MAAVGTFNPSNVRIGAPPMGGPYMNTGTHTQIASATPGAPSSNPMPVAPGKQRLPGEGQQSSPMGVLASSPVRATGSGPFDPAYRQNLATYAMGQFAPPTGGWNVNPTNPGNIGAPTGGGNAPVMGQPNTLLANALGGQPFSWAPPTPPPAQKPIGGLAGGFNIPNGATSWLDYFMGQGAPGQKTMAGL